MQMSGKGHKKILALHQKYGSDAIRTGPNSVSFLNPDAWKEFYGRSKVGQPENLKHRSIFFGVEQSVICADSDNHRRMRRILAQGFSAQAMVKQEPLIRGYIDLLFERLKEHSINDKPIDVVKWYNWFTFDLIGDLAFGEPFGCLETSSFHSWVAMVFEQFKERQLIGQLHRAYPALESVTRTVIKLMAPKKMQEHTELTKLKVEKRLALQTERHDFMDSMIATNSDGEQKMTLEEIHHNSDILIVAGSETTATTLCGVTSLLCTHPNVLATLYEEVRSSFNTEADINLLSVQRLKYMTAVIDEGMRIYPAAPASTPRAVHRGGDTICGRYLPEGTIVDIWHWAMYHSPDNFTLTESFIPERWLGDSRFANDKKAAFQPFSTGGRDCIGKNLAYAEMRLILARLVWNYDILPADENVKDWIHTQQMWTLWEKPPLNIYLKSRKSD